MAPGRDTNTKYFLRINQKKYIFNSPELYRTVLKLAVESIQDITANMSPHDTEILYEKHVLIVGFCILLGITFAQIVNKLDLETKTVHSVYTRTVVHTDEDQQNSFMQVIQQTKNISCTDRLSVVSPGSAIST